MDLIIVDKSEYREKPRNNGPLYVFFINQIISRILI